MTTETSPSFNARDAIASLALFKNMEPELLQGIIASARLANYDKGAVFLSHGQPITRFYIVLEGWCAASKDSAAGQESLLQIFQHGDFLPEPGNTYIDSSLLNLQALTPVKLMMLPPNIVRNALERSKIFMSNMLSASMQRCQDLRDHIEQLTLFTADQRVGHFLLRTRLDTNPDGDDIALPFDKSLIAAYLGIKPETFSRILQSFKEKGFTVARNHLTTPGEHALCNYCDSVTSHICQHANTDECPHPEHGA